MPYSRQQSEGRGCHGQCALRHQCRNTEAGGFCRAAARARECGYLPGPSANTARRGSSFGEEGGGKIQHGGCMRCVRVRTERAGVGSL